jgi:hypothetical protein
MENVRAIVNEIKTNLSQKSASRKDEVAVMKAMMNDPEYVVDIYDKTGKCGEYCPSKELKKIVSSAVSATTKIPMKEATALVDNYEFTKTDAAAMVDMSKEFINTYLQTGRKLPLGGRVNSNIELLWKDIEEKTTGIPTKGSDVRGTATIPAHGGIKTFNRCPVWVK